MMQLKMGKDGKLGSYIFSALRSDISGRILIILMLLQHSDTASSYGHVAIVKNVYQVAEPGNNCFWKVRVSSYMQYVYDCFVLL
jgi:hypothetical protein